MQKDLPVLTPEGLQGVPDLGPLAVADGRGAGVLVLVGVARFLVVHCVRRRRRRRRDLPELF